MACLKQYLEQVIQVLPVQAHTTIWNTLLEIFLKESVTGRLIHESIKDLKHNEAIGQSRWKKGESPGERAMYLLKNVDVKQSNYAISHPLVSSLRTKILLHFSGEI